MRHTFNVQSNSTTSGSLTMEMANSGVHTLQSIILVDWCTYVSLSKNVINIVSTERDGLTLPPSIRKLGFIQLSYVHELSCAVHIVHYCTCMCPLVINMPGV